jgi:ABC-2 type transport system ATP-binding protein
MTTGISVHALSKRFGAVLALDAVSLDVPGGEVVALLGRNGAGKSTLMRTLGTTVLPDAGSASICGFDVVRDAAAVRLRTGLVLGDERSWYWRLTGRQNLEFFAAMYGLRRRPARARVEVMLDKVQLTEAADRRFDGYSSGMRARLSLARALLVDPQVLLLDEPSRTLDPIVAVEFRAILTHLAHDDGRAVLWVTHDLHEAAEVADQVVVISQGRIVVQQPGTGAARDLELLLLTGTEA